MADQQGGNLKPVTPARVAEELRKLSTPARERQTSRRTSTSTGSRG